MSRIDRIEKELHHLISEILQKEISDPRIGFVTITRVKITADLREAKAYFTAITEHDSRDETIKGLASSQGFIRRLIGQRMHIKFTPSVKFVYDESQEKQDRIDKIIDIIHKEKETDQ